MDIVYSRITFCCKTVNVNALLRGHAKNCSVICARTFVTVWPRIYFGATVVDRMECRRMNFQLVICSWTWKYKLVKRMRELFFREALWNELGFYSGLSADISRFGQIFWCHSVNSIWLAFSIEFERLKFHIINKKLRARCRSNFIYSKFKTRIRGSNSTVSKCWNNWL